MSKIINRVGEKHITNEGYTIEIIEYFNRANCTIKFEDNNIVKNRKYPLITKGIIKNPLHKSVYDIGFRGVGKYTRTTHPKIYQTWNSMLERGYDNDYQKRHPTYKNITVYEEWHNFQNFAKWWEENYNSETMQGWNLDKDILVKDNKIYSPETCCFVPQEINLLLTKNNINRGKYPIGVHKVGNKFQATVQNNSKPIYLGLFCTIEEAFQAYKIAKEDYIKEVADKWKDKIDPKVYVAMYNYKVEIDD